MKKYCLLLILIITSNGYSQMIQDQEKVFIISELDKKPNFDGGMEQFFKYIAKKFKAPEEEGLKGKIIVEFIIEKDGAISQFNVVQDIGFGTAEEITRVFTKCPNWLPGIKDGKPVRTLYSLPITIQSGR